MFCSSCGAQNNERDAYCRNCGAPLAQSAPYGQQPGGYPGQAAPYPPQPAPEGTVGAAWHDISGTAGWAKKVLLLCLLGCVPILNFGVEGFALRWSRDLALGKREAMPKQVFRKKEILTGFRAWLVRIAYSSAFVIIAAIVLLLLTAFFGLFGYEAAAAMGMLCFVILGIAFALFFVPLENAAIMRMVTVDYLEGALNIGKIWQAYKRSLGSIMGASLLPVIIVGLIQFVVYAVFMAIIMLIAGSAPGILDSMSELRYSMNSLMYGGAGVVFLMFIMEIVMAMLSVFSMLFSWRAVGHWSARNASEWASESDEETFSARAQEREASAPSGGVY